MLTAGLKEWKCPKIIKLHAFGAEDPPILISISLARHVPLTCGIRKGAREPLLIPNHQALFLRISRDGIKRGEMTQNYQVTRFLSSRPPDSYLHQFSSPCSPFHVEFNYEL